MRILLVDDEALALEYLKGVVDWEGLGHQVVGALDDPCAAYQLGAREGVDLLVTDIRMPVMDGIELARRLKGVIPSLMVALLTGYKDFEYARRAVDLHADAFLLKDALDAQAVNDMLVSCQRQLRGQMREQLWSGQQALLALLSASGRQPFPQGRLLLGAILRPAPFALFRQQEAGRTLPEQLFSPEQLSASGFAPMACPIPQGLMVAAWDRELHRRGLSMEALLAGLLARAALPDAYALIAPSSSSPREAAGRAQQLQWAGEHSAFFSAAGLIPLKALTGHQRDQVRLYEQAFSEVERRWNADDREGMHMALRQLFSPFAQLWDLSGLYLVCDRLCALLDPLLASHALPTLREREALLPGAFYTVEQLHAHLAGQFEALFQQRRRTQGLTHSPVLKRALEWMNREYARDVSLDEAAQALGISKVYLSQLFRQQAHTTFLEALTQIRISAAKQLLRETPLKIYEVAARTGFQKSQYFSQVFKAETGLTPLKYRQGEGV